MNDPRSAITPTPTTIDTAIVDCALYRDGIREGGRLPFDVALASARRTKNNFVWLGLYEPESKALNAVAAEFGLHSLTVEDAIHAHQRPKLESYDDSVFMVLKTVRYVDPDEIIETGEVMVFLGHDFVVTVRHGEAGALANVRRGLESRPELLALGPSAVLYAVADHIVDAYAIVNDALATDVDELETAVFSDNRHRPTERIYKLKREVIEFKRAVSPLAGPLDRLARGGVYPLDPRIVPYFRDVHDHLVRAAEQVENVDELLTGAVNANVAQVTMRQNEDMRKITAWVAILASLTVITGVYGMNFDTMPELRWRYSYFVVLGVMLTVSITLYRGFRRNGWL